MDERQHLPLRCIHQHRQCGLRRGRKYLAMLPFSFTKAPDEDSALASGASGARYIAGGTTLVD